MQYAVHETSVTWRVQRIVTALALGLHTASTQRQKSSPSATLTSTSGLQLQGTKPTDLQLIGKPRPWITTIQNEGSCALMKICTAFALTSIGTGDLGGCRLKNEAENASWCMWWCRLQCDWPCDLHVAAAMGDEGKVLPTNTLLVHQPRAVCREFSKLRASASVFNSRGRLKMDTSSSRTAASLNDSL